jgi:dihydrophenazinedicarboxylate synthase
MTASAFESLTGAVDLGFPEYDDPPAEPTGLIQAWLATADRQGVREPRSLALATADARGRASNRVVAVLDITAEGLLFTSHSTSRKGRELAENRWASGLLYWRETGQQIAVSGPVALLDGARADDLWYARPTPLHAMTTASRQSERLPDVAELRAEADRLGAAGVPLPRPARFVGYLLAPAVVEFWCASADRLHRRLRYERGDDSWQVARLQP